MLTDRELETYAAIVHQAYLDTCARLGWPVKPSNQVPYEELSEESKELDRASVRAVLDALTADGWEARCDCDGVVHDLPILRSHVRGEPGCEAAIEAGSLPESSDEGSGDA